MNILSYKDIKKLLGFNSPILLDKIQIDGKGNIRGFKNITVNEDYFLGHFPGQKIMPGVLQFELMQQLAQVGIANDTQSNDIYYTLDILKKIRFKKPISPGNQLVIELNYKKDENNSYKISAKTKVADDICSVADFTLSGKSQDEILPVVNDISEYSVPYYENVILADEIATQIPHRFPFLFVDKIYELTEEGLKSQKYISNNEKTLCEFTNTEDKFLSPSYLFEIVAQSYLTVLNRLRNNILTKNLAVFTSIDNATVKRYPLAGEVLELEAKKVFFKTNFSKASFKVFVRGEQIAMGEIVCAFLPKE